MKRLCSFQGVNTLNQLTALSFVKIARNDPDDGSYESP